jgi:methylphosphotriester-DNA--protein-cysteine methyltransferase
MSAFLNQKLGQKPGSTNTPVVGVTIVKPVEPSVTLRALLSRLASELSVSEDYLSLGLRISVGTDPKQFARIARTEKVRQAMRETSASRAVGVIILLAAMAPPHNSCKTSRCSKPHSESH